MTASRTERATQRRRAIAGAVGLLVLGTTTSCADYVGASEEARHNAWVVQNSIHHSTWTPPADALAGAVERTLAASAARGGVYNYATTDEGIAVWFWVDGYVQSSGALFSAPDASVRLCARLLVSREPALETAECAGKALPLPKGSRVISL